VLVLHLQGINQSLWWLKTMLSTKVCRKHSKVLISSITNEDCLCWNFSCSKILGYCCNETLHCLLIENALGASRMVDIAPGVKDYINSTSSLLEGEKQLTPLCEN